MPACTLCLFSVAEYLIRFFILTLSIIILISNKFLCGFLEGMNTRNGTDVDAANAMRVFSKLGYKVKVHNDQTVAQIRQLLTSGELEAEPDLYRSSSSQRAVTLSCHTFLIFSAAKEDHSRSASFVCVLLSHGDEGVLFGTDGSIEIKYLTSLFRGDRCNSLVGKPKLFFIQVCLCFLFHQVPPMAAITSF